MKFKCEKGALLEAVRAAGMAVTAVSLPAEQNIRFSLTGKKLTIVGNDSTLTIQSVLNVDGQEDGEICLPSKSILDIAMVLNQHPDVGAVEISDAGEDIDLAEAEEGAEDELPVKAPSGKRVSITGGKGADFTLHQLPAGDFNSLSIGKNADKAKLKTEDFVNALKQVVDMASKSPSRPVLNGVLIEAEEKGKTRLVSSDTFRLGIRDLEGAAFSDTGSSVLVPVANITRLISLVDNAEEISFSVEETQVGFEFNGTVVITQLLSGDFPDYKKLLEDNGANTLELKRDELDQALKMVSVMAREDANQLIKADIKKDVVELSAVDRNKGSAVTTVKASYDGEDISVGLNAGYLQDVLKALEDEDMIARLSDSLKPIFIHGKKIKNFQCLLMPVRLNS